MHVKWLLGGLDGTIRKWLNHVGPPVVSVRCGALEAKGNKSDLFRYAFVGLFCWAPMSGIIFMIGIMLMNSIIWRRWGRGRKGEDSAVGKATGRSQLTKADRGRSNMQWVGTQRR